MEKGTIPQQDLHADKTQGHWVMARLGKTVLRPGGMELTKKMMNDLSIKPSDSVVEFAPGMGATAQITLSKSPLNYTAVDREGKVTAGMAKLLSGTRHKCIKGLAQDTGLQSDSATKVYSEAILTMHSHNQKKMIIEEANRLLAEDGLYGIHEVGIVDSTNANISEIEQDLTNSIKVGARPLPVERWVSLLEESGFDIVSTHTTPFHLLEPSRIFSDEGFFGALKFFGNMLRFPQERKAILTMKSVFKKHDKHLCAISVVAKKRAA